MVADYHPDGKCNILLRGEAWGFVGARRVAFSELGDLGRTADGRIQPFQNAASGELRRRRALGGP